MFKDFDINIIDKYLKEKFPIIFDFKFDGLILLYGDIIKDLIMGEDTTEKLDLVLLTQSAGNIRDFINKYHIEIVQKLDSEYELKYDKILINIKRVEDLYYCSSLNTDRLFYDIKRKIFIPIGLEYAISRNEIVEYRPFIHHKRYDYYKKNKDFLSFLNGRKHHKIRYKYSRIKYLIKNFLRLSDEKYKDVDALKKLDTKKLDKLIKEKFPLIYDYYFDGIVLLYGGVIRDVVVGKDDIHVMSKMVK